MLEIRICSCTSARPCCSECCRFETIDFYAQVRHAAQQCLEALFGGLRSSKAELQAFWSSEAGIQDLAYVTQLLLAAANAEALAGHTGSKAVRVTALRAVCNVLEAVNDPQPLSYLLPGLVGGLSKAILAGEQNRLLWHSILHLTMLLQTSRLEESLQWHLLDVNDALSTTPLNHQYERAAHMHVSQPLQQQGGV